MSQVSNIEVAASEDGMRLDRWFKTHYPALGHGKLQKLLRTGQIRLDGARAKANSRIAEQQTIRVPPLDTDSEAQRTTPKVKKKVRLTEDEIDDVRSWIIHRDDHLIIINKPGGLAAQGGSGTKRHVDGLLDALQFDRDERPRLVHRLDKDTSGAMLIARSRKAAQWYADKFKSKDAHKLYWALVVGNPRPKEGMITLPLSKMGGAKGERMIVDEDEGKFARTAYRVLDTAAQKAAWVAFQPVTGRTHQIRIHASDGLGTPVLGDGKYGGAEAYVDGLGSSQKLYLHSRGILIPNLAGGMLQIYAPLPDYFADCCRFLGFQTEPEYDLILDTE